VSKKVVVTKAQQDAAKAIVKRSATTGKYVRSSVAKMAHAPVTPASRSVSTGRYLSSSSTASTQKPAS